MRVMYYTASVRLHPQTARLVPGHVYLGNGVARRKVYTIHPLISLYTQLVSMGMRPSTDRL